MDRILLPLAAAVATLAGAVSLWTLLGTLPGPDPTPVTTLRGEPAVLYGAGLYRLDSLMTGAGFVGQDLVTLLLVVPLLLAALVLAARGRVAGEVLAMAALSSLLYSYASLALAAAYNPLFLAYVAIYSGSLFALILGWRRLQSRLAPGWEGRHGLPRKALAGFLFFAGTVTLLVWAEPLVTALVAGRAPPYLDTATTKVTEALDIGLIVPLCGVAGAQVARRSLAGYLLAVPLVGLIALLFPSIAAATWLQVRGGLDFPPTVVIPVGGFLLVGALGAWLLLRLVRAWASG